MSNYLAIATVTAALRNLLSTPIGAISGATVTALRPGDSAMPSGSHVNIYLYAVGPNAALRNSDLPTRRTDASLAARPTAALDLHYLFSFYSDDNDFTAQRLLGETVSILHAHPILSGADIDAVTVLGNPGFLPILSGSNLAQQEERVKFSPFHLNLEEMTKLWSVFFQTPYVLSVAYQAAVVLIEAEVTPQQALPVRTRRVFALPLHQPIIAQITDAAGAGLPIVAASTLLISGDNLRGGDGTSVQIDGVTLAATAIAAISDTQIALASTALSDIGLAAGVHQLQVSHAAPELAKAGLTLTSLSSAVAPFVLQPIISAISVTGGSVSVTLDPTVRAGQKVLLLLNRHDTPPPSASGFYRFAAPTIAADTNTITIATLGVAAGSYIPGVQVDGAETPVEIDNTDPAHPFIVHLLTFS